MIKENYETLKYEIKNRIITIWLNRPRVHNAFNITLLTDLVDILGAVDKDEDLRVVIFTGAGKSFSAGADLKWMSEIVDCSYDENLRDSEMIARVFYKIYTLSKPVIAAINGGTFGGGMGFVGASDIVVASDKALFSLSEVRIGVVPACISPYLIKKVGEGSLKELFISGIRFSPEKALEIKLINYVVPHDQLLEFANEKAEGLLLCGPYAIAKCKELFLKVGDMNLKEAYNYTVDLIARQRIAEEAQEGMKAFLEKRKPSWHPKEE
ncbi:MAG: enoyl-CoA hydratase/isomerase family protein [Candidatus Aminicenantes bacterium]|nr:enoyl-CoA hydratase/isomerase family protein [Candidatus Aminicenantes bacterium]